MTTQHEPRIAVLVVAYNASTTLEETLERIPDGFRDRIAEIIVADDASDDDTFEKGAKWRDRNPHINTTVVRHVENRGYGGNQKAGYQVAIDKGFDVIVLLHADGQYAPECIEKLVEPILQGHADAVFGSRMMEPGAARRGGMPLYKYVGNKILTKVENTVLGSSLSEFHSGYRAYSVAALKAIPFTANSDGFDFDTQIIVQLLDADKRILEVPIPTFYGDEICYVNGLPYARDVVKAVVSYRMSKAGFGLSNWVPPPDEYDLKEEEGSSHSIILDQLKHLPAGKVLEVGCSSGLLAEQVRGMGHHVTAIDPEEHPKVHGRADAFYRVDLDADLPDIGTGFDIIIAADVIEHVKHPEHLISELTQRLGKDGRLIISTPNFGHWYPRIRVVTGSFDYDRRGILDDTHLRFFTKRGLTRILDKVPLVVEEIRYSATPFPMVESQSRTLRAISAIDQALVKARPSLFGYQFIITMRPKNLDSIIG
ncbi:MAG: bifunctional glycosyltransferase/class I SAM-dependent methyltransferase [Marmoricola sp.]|nr:bifunctional glycosyltransferase/class I SAM-dependent methyltransferase [Nocardioidaceae bacterium]